ncbi:glycoside hydrolase family 125 protein [Atractiella rhizophila]|nr:glycoside hydrolase family 125 protein [Atractiella rhizophila]
MQLLTALLPILPVVLAGPRLPEGCPDYVEYSQTPQGNPSAGPLALPYMRPDPQCRTFNSSSVEKVITDMKARLKDPDIARLFENTFPNTLDTTVSYYNDTENIAFIITGDINAQWLRDTANQFAHYSKLLKNDTELSTLVKAIINNEARYIKQFPYCGAFQPPPESGLPPTYNEWAYNVTVNPPVDNTTVFECKYEIDSLCGFLKLSRSYFSATGDKSFANDNWYEAIGQIFRVMDEQSQPTFDENWNYISYYNWTGTTGALSPRIFNSGNGEPKAYTGMVGTHHRPSDDKGIYAYLVPANAMLSVELLHLADTIEGVGNGSSTFVSGARKWSSQIKKAIYDYGVLDGSFSFEVDGFGSHNRQDDANVPSLLSLPYLGFLDRNDWRYKKTKDRLLSRGNGYFAKGKNFFGVGGPHASPGTQNPWPMSLISSIYGTSDDSEIMTYLYTIANSQNIYNTTKYTRPWFAWANSYWAEMILDLAERKPYLIFNSSEPYIVGQ